MLFNEAWFTYQCYCGNDAIRFISQKSKDSLKSSCDNDGVDKEEKEPDYEGDEDQLEEEQEEDAGEITNQVF